MATRSTIKARLPSVDPESPPLPFPSRKIKPTSPSHRRYLLLLVLTTLFLYLTSFHLSGIVLRHANLFGRQCIPLPPYTVVSHRTLKIAIVSLSAEREYEEGSYLRRRKFKGLMEIVDGNKREYAKAMGYDFVDAGGMVDPERPPSWSKILAVRSQLRQYDWVFWNDADTVVTNSKIHLEQVLLSVIGHLDFDSSPDLVVTKDYNELNSGVFFLRRSEWSERFLDTWWNKTSLIRFGSTKSGDNTAMNHIIEELQPEEFRRHVRVTPMQCIFNSYPWFPTRRSVRRMITSPSRIWGGAYSKGDFMVHLAGLDDKIRWATEFIREMESDS